MIGGFASLTIDVGLLYNAKADLQRTADAAALAGASAYLTDAALAQEHAQVEQIVIRASQHAEPLLGRKRLAGEDLLSQVTPMVRLRRIVAGNGVNRLNHRKYRPR